MADLRGLLPNLYMLDILDDGADYRVRLFGTALVEVVGYDPTGMVMSMRPESNWRTETYDLVRVRRRPVFYRYHLGDVGKTHIRTENALLPLTDKDGNFTIIMCLSARVA